MRAGRLWIAGALVVTGLVVTSPSTTAGGATSVEPPVHGGVNLGAADLLVDCTTKFCDACFEYAERRCDDRAIRYASCNAEECDCSVFCINLDVVNAETFIRSL